METSYIKDLKNALDRRRKKEYITYSIVLSKSTSIETNSYFIKKYKLPNKIIPFYQEILSLDIDKPRKLKLLSPQEFKIIDDKYLLFSIIDNKYLIGFDMRFINEAGEWNIVNIENHFIITKTLSSYLTNKLWAWIDRNRTIWDNEF